MLQRLDLVSELTKLKVIHVAGTKGKVCCSTTLIALEGTPPMISGAMTGINMRNGRKHAAAVRLQDWIVHIATSGGCQRTHTLARVSLLLSFPESSSCIAVPNLSAVTLLGTAVTLCRDSEHIGHHTGIDLQAAYSNTDVHQALLVVFQQPERVC